ncbi:hypothetical protein K8R43_02680 [archaeon]|nr:hypothetical protein [archaeon]
MDYPTKLPKDAKPDDEITILVTNKRIGKRLVTFLRTHKEGFGKWKVIRNEPYTG